MFVYIKGLFRPISTFKTENNRADETSEINLIN